MGRRGPAKSLNSSMVSNGNNSIAETIEPDTTIEYSDFIKRFGNQQNLTEKSNVKVIGYAKTIAELQKRFEALLKPEKNLRHVLLSGPPGTSKKTILRSLIEQYAEATEGRQAISYFHLESSWTLEKQFGNPETRLRALFEEAAQKQPSVIFINRVDLICSEKRSQIEDRIFNLLTLCFERIASSKVLVIGATSKPEKLDPSMREAHGFFRHEISFSLPSESERLEYLKSKLGEIETKDLSEEQIEQIAKRSHCYTYADLVELIDLAQDLRCDDVLNYSILEKALKQLKPAAIKSITTPCQPLHWDDIGGYESVKRELQESVILRIKYKDLFKKLCGQSEKGALLYGPPGCSKTMLAHALATESGFNFISVKGPELFSKYVGDSEASVRRLYRNAREVAPCIIFFDEIDGFAGERGDNQSSSVNEKVVTTLLVELTNLDPQDNVYTIAATNRPDRVDSALLRPGRLSPAIYIPLPSEDDRRAIFKVHLPPVSDAVEADLDQVLDKLVAKTNGYSGAEIQSVCQTAGKLALRESSYTTEFVEFSHLEAACDVVRPKTRNEHLVAYQKFQEQEYEPVAGVNQASVDRKASAGTNSTFLGSNPESVCRIGQTGGVENEVNSCANGKLDSSCSVQLDKDEAKSDIILTSGEGLNSNNNHVDNDTNQDKKKRSGTLNRLMRSLSINKKINRAK